ncbi:MAG: hypothetical protein LBR79_05270 [Oscillospiraceae bacterium]|nr:hypothetical protein [Oscillospiraceae bacterium]
MTKKAFIDIIRWLIYLLEIILFYVLERNCGLIPEIFGGRPIILIPVFISIAIFEKEYVSMFFGIIIGAFLDVSISGFIGSQTAFLFILGYILGVLFTYFIDLNFLAFFLTSLIMIPVIIGYRFLFFYIIPGFDNIPYAFLHHLVPSVVYTAVISPVIYFVNRYIAYHIRFIGGGQN